MRPVCLHAFEFHSPVLCAARRHRLLRRFASLLAALMLVPALLPTAAVAQQAASRQSKAAVSGLDLSASERLADTPYLAPAHALPTAAVPTPGASLAPRFPRPLAPSSPTLLDEVGLLAHPVPAATVDGWVAELKAANITPERAALLHLWLGEWQLAHSQQPKTARQHFWHAQQWAHKAALLPGHALVAKRLYGLAAYDSATALFYRGAYQASAQAFYRLVCLKTMLSGYDRRTCARWYRHASGCANYHAERSAMGIPEPPQLDPECGVAALAACLRGLSLPYDRQRLLSVSHVTGEGNNLADILQAAKKLGVSAHSVTADDAGLIALPKPLVAYVERDHFIAVVKADKTGVSYLCSDCGPWPGGRVDLTWAQWHALDPGTYACVTKPGSVWDRTLSAALTSAPSPAVKVASVGSLRGLGTFHANMSLPVLSLMQGHVVRYIAPTAPLRCGFKPTSQQCPPYIICCWDCYEKAMMNGGASDGDPVNLSTGEEEYKPAPDMTVYNPIGPSVVWQRVYNSLRSDGSVFGSGWSHSFNNILSGDYEIGTTAATTYNGSLILANGAAIPFNFSMPQQKSWGGPSVPTYGGTLTCTNAAADMIFTCVWYWVYSQAPGDANTNAEVAPYYATPTPTQVSILFRDRSQFVYSPALGAGSTIGTNSYKIYNPTGQWISVTPNAITDSNNKALLTISQPSNNTVTAVDCYGREVIYQISSHLNHNVPTTDPTYPQSEIELDHVSQVVSSSSTSGPDRWAYGYVDVKNNDAGVLGSSGETIPFLGTITVPSPTGTGTSTATINYSANTCFVSSLQDGNGNTRTYTPVPSTNATNVTVMDSNNHTLYNSTSHFDNTLEATSRTDAAGATVSQSTYPPPTAADPFRPTSVMDANAIYRVVPGGAPGPNNTLVPTTFAAYGTNATGSSGNAWEVKLGSAVVDHGGSSGATGSGGWTVSYAGGNFTVRAPSGLPTKAHYEVRYGYGTGVSAFFDVGPYKAATQYVYDQYGNLHQMTDPRGTVTNYTYGFPSSTYSTVSANTPTNTTSKADAFPMGELLTVQEGSKTPTTYTYYDSTTYPNDYRNSGLVHTASTPTPGTINYSTPVTTTYTYDTLGNILTVVTPGNNSATTITTTYAYTDGTHSQAAIGQPLSVKDNLGKFSYMSYSSDGRGNLASETDALGNETDYTYNIADQPLQTTFPATGQSGTGHGSTVNSYLYPAGPLLSTVANAESGNAVQETDYAYGAEGELLSVTGSTEPVYYTYDQLYRLKTLADGNSTANAQGVRSPVTSYSYNAAGYLANIRYPGYNMLVSTVADRVQFPAYDNDGNLLQRIDGNGVETDYAYNDADSLLSDIQYPATPALNVHSHYDAYGRRDQMVDSVSGLFNTGGTVNADGTVTNPGVASTYDDDDNPFTTTTTYKKLDGTLLPMRMLTYAYYPDGSRQTLTVNGLSLAITGGSNATTTFAYTYDQDGRMKGLTNPFGETTQWIYLDNGWLYSQQLQNNIITSYSYNGRGWLTGQVSQLPSTMMVASFGGTSGPSGTAMGYDAVGNRLQETAVISSRYSGTSTYQYDKGGSLTVTNNRSQLTGEAFASADQNFSSYTNYHTYDANNALGPGNPTAFSAATSSPTYVNRTYNADNQLTGDAASNTYAYDGNGNPTTYKNAALTFDPENRLTSYGTTLSNGYTAEGLRAWKRSGTGTPNYYLYDGDDPICELDGSDGSFKRVNTWGANGLISRITKASSTGYYTYDPEGNLCQLLNGGAGVSVTYHADAFGNVTSSNGSGATFAFGAQWGYSQDSETGFVLCGHRFYDPTNGRWITRDPIDYSGGINLYGFCSNNSVNIVDPSGLYDSDGTNEIHPRPDPVNPGDYLQSYVCHHPVGPGRNFPKPLRDAINDLGNTYGCHTCGSKDPGTGSGNFIIDHQPPIRLNPDPDDEYAYAPQCRPCSNSQGGSVSHMPISNPRLLPPQVPVPPVEEVPIEGGGALGGGGGSGPVGQRHLPFM